MYKPLAAARLSPGCGARPDDDCSSVDRPCSLLV
jgi:hypothetical protein